MPTVFERLPAGELPCARVYEDELVFALMDAGQVNDGHVVVATKRPCETLTDATDDEAAAPGAAQACAAFTFRRHACSSGSV